ncbi:MULTISPECIES: hypothetical protein [Aggregatibacter]|jgi:hypothetical protein|uniref:anti-sigma factor family protein n=1 Tax=Aggregatibacter TaxID=416916 RepID=UPI000D6543EE|nr:MULTISPECIES: hypothetical protein [Aggregatibacter]
MKCQNVTKLISESQEKPLSLLKNGQVYMHLAICPYCRAFARNCKEMHKMMQDFSTQEEGKES